LTITGVEFLALEDIMDFRGSFDHTDDMQMLACLSNQRRYSEPTVHEDIFGIDSGT
jgi:hypothetical protein